MSSWMIVTSPANFARTVELEFAQQGMKSRHRKKAAQMAPGDPLIFYITGEAAFGAAAEVACEYFEDHSPIWTAPGKPAEDYPWRVRLRNVVAPGRSGRIAAFELKDRLAHVRKWPEAHWKLAFQGNVHWIPDADAALVRASLKAAARAARL